MINKDFLADVSKVSAYISSLKQDCVAHNFRLVKIKLPPEIFTLLKIQTIETVQTDELKKPYGDVTGKLCGVPVEEDGTVTQPRYVIEADGIDVL